MLYNRVYFVLVFHSVLSILQVNYMKWSTYFPLFLELYNNDISYFWLLLLFNFNFFFMLPCYFLLNYNNNTKHLLVLFTILIVQWKNLKVVQLELVVLFNGTVWFRVNRVVCWLEGGGCCMWFCPVSSC